MTGQSTGPEVTVEDLGRTHLVGIGGVGMSALARLLLTRGVPVSGSELVEWPALAGLRALGATIFMRHSAANLGGVDTVVYSSAIPADNVELAAARARRLRLLHRSEVLAAAMAGRRVVAVTGTHGKTTTTSMITSILRRCGRDPSFVIGGELLDVGAGAQHGSGEHFVVEADESDRSFLRYWPDLAVVTNIDADHLNTYGDLDSLQGAFEEFGARVRPGGLVLTFSDTAATRSLAERLRATGVRVATYGEAADATLRLTDLRSTPDSVRYAGWLDGEPLGEITVPVPGRHLGLNSAAAVLAALRLGLARDPVVEALAAFPGVRRRFERKGIADGVRVYDEYAYHPTSMTAALGTLRELVGDGRVIVVFQPYRFYRTRDLLAELAVALAIADEVIVLEVFGPGEARLPADGGAALANAVPLPPGCKVFVDSLAQATGEVCRRARAGDVVVTMGAPPISLLGDEFLAALAARTWAGAVVPGRERAPVVPERRAGDG